ncbi:hypothetical protein Ddye_010155 [Dipteronia dyeriana]|uniref:Uncharacterized protein n=1 Tax=Dipteronia dyeriana TaxID=168575 RepID=A0AAE0CNJ6_9ROSI|nr:hypothetical protein Ddye_010155 [Dipteronia dyeriana]
MEYQLDVSHLGQIRIRDDIFGVAIIIGWSDPPMRARSKVTIPGLLRRIRDLEMRSLESNGFEGVEGNNTSVAPVVSNEEVNCRGQIRRNWLCVVVVAVGIVMCVWKKLLENM